MIADGHPPVLLHETCAALVHNPAGIYVDATFGRGGHSREILARLNAQGRLLAMDRDPEAVAYGHTWTDSRFSIVHQRFSRLAEVLAQFDVAKADGVLLDLGLCTTQVRDARRGMSFMVEGPLDMRMDTTQGMTAATWLAMASVDEIKEVLKNYGEERFAAKIAKAIVVERQKIPLVSTGQLVTLIQRSAPPRPTGRHSATRSFQALRILVNQEMEELALVLKVCGEKVAVGGRLAVISFHPLEDQQVKRCFAPAVAPMVKEFPLARKSTQRISWRPVGRAIRPSDEEVQRNPQARSAVLRVAERLSA